MFEYSLFWGIAYMALGIFLYYRDRTFNVKIYRIYHNMVKRPMYKLKNYPESLSPLDENSEIGFLHGQSAKNRYKYLLTLSFIQSALTWYFTGMNPIIEVLFAFVEAGVALFGMAIAPKLFPFLKNRDELFFEKIDEIEKIGFYETFIKERWTNLFSFLKQKKDEIIPKKNVGIKQEDVIKTSTNIGAKTNLTSDENIVIGDSEAKPKDVKFDAREAIRKFAER